MASMSRRGFLLGTVATIAVATVPSASRLVVTTTESFGVGFYEYEGGYSPDINDAFSLRSDFSFDFWFNGRTHPMIDPPPKVR